MLITAPPTPSVADLVVPGFYRHYKGAIYEVLAVSVDEADGETRRVTYRGRDGQVWCRTIEDFTTVIVPSFEEALASSVGSRYRFTPLAQVWPAAA